MKVRAINNNNQSFKALKITPEAKTIIEKQAGGAERIAKYTSELANSKMDLTIKALGKDSIFPYFGDRRVAAVMPAHLKDNYVMVYSGYRFGDNDDDIVDCLKFASTQRAEEVYNKLKTFSHYSNKKSVNEKLDWHVYATKLFDEAEIVPQKKSPWAMWVQDYKPSFKAIEFSTVKARQKFMSALKKQSIVDFNESMNIIKAQHDNYEHIYIKAKPKGNNDKLNLYAVIRKEVVDTGNSFLEFLKNCAQKADSYKIESYQERIKEGSISERAVKDLIYARATREFKHTALPFDLFGA